MGEGTKVEGDGECSLRDRYEIGEPNLMARADEPACFKRSLQFRCHGCVGRTLDGPGKSGLVALGFLVA